MYLDVFKTHSFTKHSVLYTTIILLSFKTQVKGKRSCLPLNINDYNCYPSLLKVKSVACKVLMYCLRMCYAQTRRCCVILSTPPNGVMLQLLKLTKTWEQ